MKGKKKTDPRKESTPRPSDASAEDVWHSDPDTIRRFLAVRRDHEQLCGEIEYILRKRIADAGIEVAAITSRAKTLNSFLEKLQRKGYANPFAEVTDISGVRVVCLYPRDVAVVADLIRQELLVDEEADKADMLAVDKFGYSARHFIVRLGAASSGARYDDLKHLRCEIQVRTVLQDAWAIIQHHLVYKKEAQAPPQIQRKLNSLAGLLETADDQFERIREERGVYITQVERSSQRTEQFLENPLNLDTFQAYLKREYPGRAFEAFDGQGRMALDGLLRAGMRTLREMDKVIKSTAQGRALLKARLEIKTAPDGTVPANIEAALALALSVDNWKELIRWGPEWEEVIAAMRAAG